MSATLLAAVIGVLVILLIVGIVLAIKFGTTKVTVLPGGAQLAAEEPVRRPSDIAPPATLKTALAIAMRELRVLVTGGRGPTDVPWALVIGAGGDKLAPLLPPPLDAEHEIGWLDEEKVARAGTVSFRTGGVVLGFEDGLAGEPQAERRLTDLLREVEVVRPDRPIDSLVIVLPWTFLVSASEEAIAARGRQLYNLALTLQQRTGWRVPVYVLISEAEKLPGFAAIGRAVLARAVSPLIGWPAPKTLDSVFQPSWIDDAFDAMRGALSIEQLHVLMGLEGDRLAEEVLLLPAHLADARPALKLLMTQMLENSVYHEGFMLRGIFLTGETESPALAISVPEQAGEGAPPPPKMPQRLAQVLFLDKIFPEAGLAQPAYGERTRRHRMIRRTQWALAAAAALFALGLGLISYLDAHRVPPIQALLANIDTIEGKARKNRAETRDASGGCVERSRIVRSDQTREEFERDRDISVSLLEQMSELDLHRIETWLAPTSFFSGANATIETAVKKSFQDVVFNAIADSMTTPAGIEELVDRNARADDFEAYWGAILHNAATYERHYLLLKDMQELKDIQDLRALAPEDTGVLKDFAEVVQYSLGEQLPPRFTRNYRVYSEGVTEYPVPCLYSNLVGNTLRGVLTARYEKAVTLLYSESPVSLAWNRIAARFGEEHPDLSEKSMRDLVGEVDDLASALSDRRRYAWIYAPTPADLPMPEIKQLERLESLRRGSGLTSLPDVYRPNAVKEEQRLREATLFGQDVFELDDSEDAKKLLAKPAAASVASQPVSELAGLPRLTESMVDTRNFLHTLFTQPFMGDMGEPRTYSEDPRTGWDVAQLQSAQAALKSYSDFAAGGSGQMPDQLRTAALDIAQTRFGEHISRLVGEAAQRLSLVVNPTQSTAEAASANFNEALPLLINIRDSLAASGAKAAAADLDRRIARQAGLLLGDAERDLKAGKGPYGVDDIGLASWKGQGSLASAVFGVESVDDLKASLPQRRARMTALARARAAPLVKFLLESQAAGTEDLKFANRWAAILQALDAYDGNSPNNTLSRLERYMTVDLDQLDWQNCAKLSGAGSARQGDYFVEQQRAIVVAIMGRCRTIAIGRINEQYSDLRKYFNDNLAGRFPFSSYDSTPGADPANVQEFYQKFGSVLLPLHDAIAGAPVLGESGREAASVLDRLIHVRDALAPMLDAGAATLSYKVDVEFFPRVPQAVGQSQVLGASIGTPDSLANDDGAGSFTWHGGDPIAVRLRWAANAPTLPLPPDGKCAPQPGGNLVGFDTGGNWALLRLLRERGPEPRVGDVGPGVPIAFEVDLCENRARASGGDPVRERARIFLRLSLTQTIHTPDKPDRQEKVVLPPFPDSVPALIPPARR